MCLRVSYKKKYMKENNFLGILKVTERRVGSGVEGTDARIRTKMSRIPNTAQKDGTVILRYLFFYAQSAWRAWWSRT